MSRATLSALEGGRYEEIGVRKLTALLEAVGGRPLGRRGNLQFTGAAPSDSVNMISCNEDTCEALIDPGAHGAGVAAEVASQ